MPRNAKRRLATGNRRRLKKRQGPEPERYLHLSAGEVGVRTLIQTVYASSTLFCSYSTLCLTLALVARRIAIAQHGHHHNIDVIDQAVIGFVRITLTQLSMMDMFRDIDTILYDIPLYEAIMPKTFTCSKDLRINDLSDPAAHQMTHFFTGQLQRLYDAFDFVGFVAGLNDDTTLGKIPFYTGSFRDGSPNRYLIHPEEVFLFTMTKIATGRKNNSIVNQYFGGGMAKWSLALKWTLSYLDNRYKNILGHQGLTRYLFQFPLFRSRIEQYCQREHKRENPGVDNGYTIYPGLERLPFNIFGFIDNTIDKCSVPHSGPRGDYVGAARKVDYDDAQQAVYSGYKRLHGIKEETVYLPNGLSFVFGPVSARRNDRGVLQMSNLSPFLSQLQAGMFEAADGTEVKFGVFGDKAYNIAGNDSVRSYYVQNAGDPPLNNDQLAVNRAMRSARMTIEKNYGMVSSIFKICHQEGELKLAKKNPYVCEQLRVCHLLTNCYICLNGDQGSSPNTFDCRPPKLEDYLQL